MVDILHRVGVTATPENVYAALTTADGLSSWWTEGMEGDGGTGELFRVRFADAPPPAGFDIRVLAAEPAKFVRWEVVFGPEEWIGTHISFELKQEDGFTIVLFRHEDWREPVEFMSHCSTKWATFLMSLKRLVESGMGEPAPRDVKISNWH